MEYLRNFSGRISLSWPTKNLLPQTLKWMQEKEAQERGSLRIAQRQTVYL